MNSKTLIGIVLIFLIFVGFSMLNRPSQDDIDRQKRYNDSVERVHAENANRANIQDAALSNTANDINDNDSTKALQFGVFANVLKGDTNAVEVETELLKLRFSPKGGFLSYAELKNYKTHLSQPLVLFDGLDENYLNFALQTIDNRVLNSKEFVFNALPIAKNADNQIITMRLNVNDSSYLDFVYTVPNNSYQLDFNIVAHNMQGLFYPMTSTLDFTWFTKIRQQERGRKSENRYTTLNFMYENNDIERLSESKNSTENASTPLKWFAAKDLFFSTVLLNKNNFQSAKFSSEIHEEDPKFLKTFTVSSSINFDPTGTKSTNLQIFVVPNKYQILNSFNKNLPKHQKPNIQELIPLGWALFRWISQFLIIPLFNFFGSFIGNWGVIIVIVTIIVKIIILPLTFKSYMSTAKMRVLKPQLDAINAKIPQDKVMERQQAQMQLYRSVGVSPMGGCLPMLLQMPVLFAVFMFLPSSIELRQQAFLWADDLSTYDALFSWTGNIPLISSTIGNHISLFCLLMTIANVVYTKINMSTQMGQPQQMAMMKWMMYLMPIMFFFIFNTYASGLTWYYLVSLLFTIIQTYLFRLFVDEDKLLKKLELAKLKKKPAKKSGFMARLEEMQKEQQKRIREQAKGGKKR